MSPQARRSILAETAWSRRRLYALANRVGTPETSDDFTITVTAAVERSQAAAEQWLDYTVDERADVLSEFPDLVAANQAESMDLIQLETGKSRIGPLDSIPGVPEDLLVHRPISGVCISPTRRGRGWGSTSRTTPWHWSRSVRPNSTARIFR